MVIEQSKKAYISPRTHHDAVSNNNDKKDQDRDHHFEEVQRVVGRGDHARQRKGLNVESEQACNV